MKKGVMFSLISVVVSGLIVLLFWTSNAPRLDQNADAIETRVTIMNLYVSAWDSYVQDATRILVRSYLSNLTSRIPSKVAEARYTHDEIRGNLSRCLTLGATNFETAQNESCSTPVNQSLTRLLTNFSNIAASRMNIDTSFVISDDFNITDWAPFEVSVTFTLNYTITDAAFATWNRSNKYRVIVSVADLPDPLFEHYADENGRMLSGPPDYTHRLLHRYNKTRDLFNKTDVENVVAQQAYYEHLGTGPTYLERLRGIRSGALDPNELAGIETLINPAHTDVDSNFYKNTSFTDFQIFDDQNSYRCGNETLAILDFAVDDFYLDIDHLARLGFNGSLEVLDYDSCDP